MTLHTYGIDVTNDLNYYTFMSESFLTSYGLEGMINPTDWTQNFPLVSILRAYMQIAGRHRSQLRSYHI